MTLCTLSWLTVLVLFVYAIVAGFGWALGARIFGRIAG